MTTSVEEEYADVLQNIESAIVIVYNQDSGLVDRDVLAAIGTLLRAYTRESRSRVVDVVGPSGRARKVFEQCRCICEWRLGRAPLNPSEHSSGDPPPGELSVSEMILCLKRIRKSVRLWHSQAGRQGYLNYVREFLGDAASQTVRPG